VQCSALKRLAHANIIQVIGEGIVSTPTRNRPMVVLEWLDGICFFNTLTAHSFYILTVYAAPSNNHSFSFLAYILFLECHFIQGVR
jgi:hypothetical protein